MKAAICFATFLFYAPAAFAAPFLVGTWFGEGQPGDKYAMWVARMGAHGEFRAEFRSCDKGKATDLSQTGVWSLTGDTETIQIQTADGRPYARTDVYKILGHDGAHQTYRYLPTGWVYNSRRVPDGFQLPSCEAIS